MTIDIIVGLVAIFCFWFGFTKGVIRAFLTIVGLAVGFMVALRMSPAFTQFLRDSFGEWSNLMPVLAFVLLFVGSFLIFKLLGRAIEGFFKKIDINLVNKLAGGVLFSAIGLVLISSLLYFLDGAALLSERAKSTSMVYPYLDGLPEKAASFVKIIFPVVKDWILELWDLFK